MGVLETESERLNRFLNELSERKSLDDGDTQGTRLFEALEETIFLVQNRLKEKRIRLEVSESSLIKVPLSKDQLKQIFLNLFFNSVDAFEQVKRIKGKLIRIEIRTLFSNRLVEIRFQDNGMGIPKKLLDSIFDPFFTTKEKGTGLGLYNIQKDLLRVGGDISVNSVEGKGTTFILKLPVVEEKEGCL